MDREVAVALVRSEVADFGVPMLDSLRAYALARPRLTFRMYWRAVVEGQRIHEIRRIPAPRARTSPQKKIEKSARGVSPGVDPGGRGR